MPFLRIITILTSEVFLPYFELHENQVLQCILISSSFPPINTGKLFHCISRPGAIHSFWVLMGMWTAFSPAWVYCKWWCVNLLPCIVRWLCSSLGRAWHSVIAGAVRWLPDVVTPSYSHHSAGPSQVLLLSLNLALMVFPFSHSSGCMVVLICFSLMADHGHHFFILIGLLSILFYEFSFEVFHPSLFVWEYVSFTYWFVYSFYTSECNLLLTLYLAAIFLYSGLSLWFHNDVFC